MENCGVFPMRSCMYRAKPTEELPYITDPIVFEILSWVPAHDLVRYKAVCRQWKSWTEEPSFIELHKNRAPKSIIGTTRYFKYNRIQLCDGGDVFILSERFLILGSSSCGLVCVKTDKDEYYVINPATGKSLKLPPLEFNTYAMEMRVYMDPHKKEYIVAALCRYHSTKHLYTYFWASLTIGVRFKWSYKDFVDEIDPFLTCWSVVLGEIGPTYLLQYRARKNLNMMVVRLHPSTRTSKGFATPFYAENNNETLLSAHEWDGKFSISIIKEKEIQTWILKNCENFDDYGYYVTSELLEDWIYHTVILPSEEELGFNRIHSVCFVQDGKMWLRTRSINRDIFSLDLKTRKVEKVTGNGVIMYDLEPYRSTLLALEQMK